MGKPRETRDVPLPLPPVPLVWIAAKPTDVFQGEYNFRGINSSSSDTKGIFRGSLTFDGAGGVTGQYFDRSLARMLNAANPFTIGAGSQYTVAEDGTFTATLNVGQAQPLNWSGALRTSGEIIFTSRMAGSTAGSGSMSAAPGNVQARGILAPEATTPPALEFSNYTATFSIVETNQICDGETSTTKEDGRTVEMVQIASDGTVSAAVDIISGSLSLNSDDEIEGTIDIKVGDNTTTYTVEEGGTIDADGKIELTAESGNNELTITLVRVANVAAQAEEPTEQEQPAPNTLGISSPPGSSPFSLTFDPFPIVQILDQNGDVLASDNTTVVTVSLNQPNPAPNPAGVLTGTTLVTVVNGQARFSDLKIAQPADGYTLSFSANNFATVTSGAFNISNELAAAELRFVQQPQDTPAGIVFNLPVTLQTLDQNGALLPGDNSTSVDITLVQTSGNLQGTSNQTAVGGTVTFDDLQVDTAGTSYTLQATSGVLSSATSDPFDVTPDPSTTVFFGAIEPTLTSIVLGSRVVSGLNIFADPARPNIAVSQTLFPETQVQRNGFVYIALSTFTAPGDPELVVVNTATDSVAQRVSLGTNTATLGLSLTLSADGRTLFLADRVNATLRAFAVEAGSGLLTEFSPNLGAGAPLPAVPLSIGIVSPFFDGPAAIAYDSGREQLIALTSGNSGIPVELHVFDYNTATRQLTAVAGSPFAFTGSPTQAAIHGNFAYVHSQFPDEFQIFNTADYSTVVGSPTTAGQARELLHDPGNGLLFLNLFSGDVQTFQINPADGSLTDRGSVTVPGGVDSITLADTPSGKALVVINDGGLVLYPLNNSTGAPQPPTTAPGDSGNPETSFAQSVRGASSSD